MSHESLKTSELSGGRVGLTAVLRDQWILKVTSLRALVIKIKLTQPSASPLLWPLSDCST